MEVDGWESEQQNMDMTRQFVPYVSTHLTQAVMVSTGLHEDTRIFHNCKKLSLRTEDVFWAVGSFTGRISHFWVTDSSFARETQTMMLTGRCKMTHIHRLLQTQTPYWQWSTWLGWTWSTGKLNSSQSVPRETEAVSSYWCGCTLRHCFAQSALKKWWVLWSSVP